CRWSIAQTRLCPRALRKVCGKMAGLASCLFPAVACWQAARITIQLCGASDLTRRRANSRSESVTTPSNQAPGLALRAADLDGLYPRCNGEAALDAPLAARKVAFSGEMSVTSTWSR